MRKKLIQILILSIFSFVGFSNIQAQTTTPSKSTMTLEEKVGHSLQIWKGKLKLTDEQVSQIMPLALETAEQVQANIADETLSKEERNKLNNDLREDFFKHISGILTKSQNNLLTKKAEKSSARNRLK